MLMVVPAADCELIVEAAEPGSLDTKLSQPTLIGQLVGMSLLRLYSNDVTGSTLDLSGATVPLRRRREWKPEYKTRIKKAHLS
jgi:hypothetical protein